MSESLPYDIRFLNRDEWEDAMGLAWKTFLAFEGSIYSAEGIRNFQNFITDSTLKRMFVMGVYTVMAAYHGCKMVGMISLRDRCHISLLFVDKNYHRRGIGRALVMTLADYAKKEMNQKSLTVDSSPYGIEFYHSLGFKDLESERRRHGIIVTPMILDI